MDLLIILVEVSFVSFVFFFVNWLVNKVFKLLFQDSLVRNERRSIKTLRQNIKGVSILTCLLLCLLILAADGFLLYQGENLQQYTLLLIHRIPSGFWVTLGIGIAQSIGTLILAGIVVKFG